MANSSYRAQAGHKIVGHVHDEVIIEAPPATTVEEICEEMQKTPGWEEVYIANTCSQIGPRATRLLDAEFIHTREAQGAGGNAKEVVGWFGADGPKHPAMPVSYRSLALSLLVKKRRSPPLSYTTEAKTFLRLFQNSFPSYFRRRKQRGVERRRTP